MTNSDAGGDVMSELVRAVGAEYDWPDFKPVQRTKATIDPSTLPALAAVYQGERGLTATVTHENGRLLIQAPRLGPAPVELHPSSPTEFLTLAAALIVRFADDRESLAIQQGSNALTLKRVK